MLLLKYNNNNSSSKMTTIHFKVDKLSGGYEPVLKYYNANKPVGSQPLCEAKVAEGGFEIKLNAKELEHQKTYFKGRGGILSDYNNTVRQLRFAPGACLSSGYRAGFTQAETELLFLALQHSLGANSVLML